MLSVLCISLLFASGCSRESNNKGKIEGTKWDNERATIDGKEIIEGEIYLEFKKDGKLTYGKFDGTYVLGAGDHVTFNFNEDVAGRKSHVEKISVDGDKLTLSDSKGTIVFTRIRDDKYENTDWVNEAGDGKGKYGDMPASTIDLHFDQDRTVRSLGEKVGTFTQGPGETLTIEFTVKFKDTDWKSKNMPVTEHSSFSMSDSEGNVIRFKRR